MTQEATNAELLQAITKAQTHTDERIDEILEVVNEFSTKMDGRMDKMDGRMDKLEKDVGTLKSDVGYIKSNMIDKDHLENRLAKYHGDLVVLLRGEDAKVRTLVEVLREKQVLTDPDVKRILSMEPFAQLSV